MQAVPSGRWRDCYLRLPERRFEFRSFVYITFWERHSVNIAKQRAGSLRVTLELGLAQQPVARLFATFFIVLGCFRQTSTQSKKKRSSFFDCYWNLVLG